MTNRTSFSSTAADGPDEISLVELARGLWQRRWLIVLLAALGALAGGTYGFVASAFSSHTSSATLILEERRPGLLGELSERPPPMNVSTQREILGSRSILAQVVREADLLADPEFNPRAGRAGPAEPSQEIEGTIDELDRAVVVDQVPGTTILRVAATSRDREKSAALASTMARVYASQVPPTIDVRVLGVSMPRPESPLATVLLALVGGALVGGAVGVGFVALAELGRQSVRSADELRRWTGMDVIGRLRLAGEADDDAARVREAMRHIRITLDSMMPADGTRVVVVTSSVPGEGGPQLAQALAASYARSGARTLLLVSDDRAESHGLPSAARSGPALPSRDAPPPAPPGAASFGSVVRRTDIASGLDVLPIDGMRNEIDEIETGRVAMVVDEARGAYDAAVVSMAAVLSSADARLFARQADAVLYAVGRDATPRATVLEGLELLTASRVSEIGLVLVDGGGQPGP